MSEIPCATSKLQRKPMSFVGPSYSPQPVVETDGLVQSGNVVALVDKLSRPWISGDHMTIDREKTFQDVFLMTFRTFITVEELLQMLIGRYRTPCPQNLPSQRRILMVLSALWQGMTLTPTEKHSIATSVEEFLGQVLEPPLIKTAQYMAMNVKSEGFRMEKVCNMDGEAPIISKIYLSKPNISHIAEQLTLFEFDLFRRITPHECIPSATQGENLHNFCGSYDKFVAWIITTILSGKEVGQRAGTVSFWIKVAEKCYALANFFSMSAVLTALSSTPIEGLKCTWSCVPSKSQSLFDDMNQLNDPGGGFSKCRSLIENTDGPCVPLITMYLTDLAHISARFSDQDGNISFLKRQQWYEVVKAMLRSQTQSYDHISEDRSALRFISDCLNQRVIRDWYDCVLQSELEYCENVALLGGDPPLNKADIVRLESLRTRTDSGIGYGRSAEASLDPGVTSP
ncbi:ras guanine nucleotide exchange factor domain-containing protein [Mycena olivaceomarginata]|nr:ras guanine nucleotide exchange factor domain-containing protein [Mycena olivaceomarginata]